VVPPLVPVSFWTAGDFERAAGPVPILADMLDPDTGEFKSLVRSATVVDGALVEAYRVEANSGPALEGAGNSLREVRHTTDADLAELRGRARSAVDHLIALGLVEFTKATTERADETIGADTVELQAWIKDLTLQNDLTDAKPFTIPRRR
jgi:hypothetical protein